MTGTVARRVLVLLAALAVMAVTARLGVWQLDRAAQKEALQDRIEQQAGAPALPAEALARDPAAAAAQHYRRITLRGTWLAAQTVYLDNRQMRGRPGFFVLTPLLLPAGDAVVVQRGWIPRDLLDRRRLASVATPGGEVTVQGRVAPWPSQLTALGADEPGAIRQNLDLADYQVQTQRALRPLSVTELAHAGNEGDGLLRDWPLPAVDVDKNNGYAAQWFAFCALTAGLYVWFQLYRPWRQRRRHPPGARG
ncbi:MAG: SURF1 family protein [Burkholderiaceae bacterium]